MTVEDTTGHPFEPLPAYGREINELRREVDGYKALVKARELIIEHAQQIIEDRGRVIARLLDGWGVMYADHDGNPSCWYRYTGGIDHHGSETELVSDGEAAIIRSHSGRPEAS